MAGWKHSGALTTDGELFLWGEKSKFCLGIIPPELKAIDGDYEKG
jgi:alpha-tubulin suppressor-like RCC1 family protein